MEIRTEFLALVLACAAVTAIPRVLPLVALSRVQLPAWLLEWLRYVPIAVLSAALAPALRAVPAWKNALLGLQLTDETFVVASMKERITPAWMAGLNLAAWSTWALANLAGAALAGFATDTRALGFALPAMFAGLLVLQLRVHARARIALAVAATAAICGITLQKLFPGPWAIVGAAVIAASIGLALQRWKSAPSS